MLLASIYRAHTITQHTNTIVFCWELSRQSVFQIKKVFAVFEVIKCLTEIQEIYNFLVVVLSAVSVSAMAQLETVTGNNPEEEWESNLSELTPSSSCF